MRSSSLAIFATTAAFVALFPAPSDAGIGYSQLSLETCTTDSESGPYQSWDYGKSLSVRTFELWGSHAGWEVLGDAVPNASFWAPPGGGRALTLTPDVASTTVVDKASGLCVTAAVAMPHAGLTLQPCSSESDLQTFSYSSSTGVLTHVASGLCVDAGAPRFGCLPGSIAAAFPYCNTSLSFPDRVADLVGRLSLQEKSLMLDTSSGGSPSAGLQTINIWDEGLHGVANNVGVGFVTTTPYATAFPQPITSSCSFNRTLWTAMGATISEEFRAFSNAGHAGLTAWSPNINEVSSESVGMKHGPTLTRPPRNHSPCPSPSHSSPLPGRGPPLGPRAGNARRGSPCFRRVRRSICPGHAGGRRPAVHQDGRLREALGCLQP
jgi:hypothetical protein